MRLLTLIFCLVPLMSFAADPTKPHSHQGKVKAYSGEPPKITLSPEQLKKIDAGETAYTQTSKDNGGNAVAVFKVDAPVATVRKIIADFGSYKEWIPSLKGLKIYKEDKDAHKYWAEFNIEVTKFFVTTQYTYYIEHTFPLEAKGWGTWKLDYSRLSDLDESVGFWRVDPVDDNPKQSLVFYSVDLRIGGLLNLIKGIIIDEGLKEATQWVKKAAAVRMAEKQKTDESEKIVKSAK